MEASLYDLTSEIIVYFFSDCYFLILFINFDDQSSPFFKFCINHFCSKFLPLHRTILFSFYLYWQCIDVGPNFVLTTFKFGSELNGSMSEPVNQTFFSIINPWFVRETLFGLGLIQSIILKPSRISPPKSSVNQKERTLFGFFDDSKFLFWP